MHLENILQANPNRGPATRVVGGLINKADAKKIGIHDDSLTEFPRVAAIGYNKKGMTGFALAVLTEDEIRYSETNDLLTEAAKQGVEKFGLEP